MDDQARIDVVSKFSPEFRKRYEEARANVGKRITNLPNGGSVLHLEKGKPFVAPLVKRVIPNTTLGRSLAQTSEQQQEKLQHFIQPVEPVKTSTPPNVENNTLTIDGWKSYYELLKGDEESKKEPEVLSFVQLVDSIPRACGCVRGALNDSAQSMYGQMLPILQARNPDFFSKIKEAQKVSKLVFREGDLVLLEV